MSLAPFVGTVLFSDTVVPGVRYLTRDKGVAILKCLDFTTSPSY